MDKVLILYPLFAQVLLTMLVWACMYTTRIREILRKAIPVQSLADNEHAKKQLKDVSGPSENLINLFEVPILFYVAILLIYLTDQLNSFALITSWFFVLLRYLHSYIHSTYNKILHRFSVYFLSTLILWALWINIILSVISN